jgi:hypothetical protein
LSRFARLWASIRHGAVLGLLLVVLAGCSPAWADDWTREDTYRQTALTALLVVDWAQTRWIVKHPDPINGVQHSEGNPLLGSHPSVGRVNNLLAASIIAQAGIAYMLPPEWRRGWQHVWIGIEAGAVFHNHSVGVKLEF